MNSYEKQLEYRIDKQEDLIRSLCEEIKDLEEKLEEAKLVYSVEWVIEDEDYEKVYGYAENFEDACRRLFQGIDDYNRCITYDYKFPRTVKQDFMDLDYWWICITDVTPNVRTPSVNKALNTVDFAIQIDPEGEIMSCLNDEYRKIFERVKHEQTKENE